jgi:hypothetical protein
MMLNQSFIQDSFNPEEISFRALPVLQTMLPEKEGKV